MAAPDIFITPCPCALIISPDICCRNEGVAGCYLGAASASALPAALALYENASTAADARQVACSGRIRRARVAYSRITAEPRRSVAAYFIAHCRAASPRRMFGGDQQVGDARFLLFVALAGPPAAPRGLST